MNFLRKTLLTNNANAMDVELEDLESGSRTASSSSHQPTTVNSSVVVSKHPLDPIIPSSQLEAPLSLQPNQPTPSPFSFHALQSGPPSDAFTFPPQAPQTAISTRTLQLTRNLKRPHQVEEHNKVRIIELGPTAESTKVIFILNVLIFY